MNIFVTDTNYNIAALHLDDARLRKMNVETAQIVGTAYKLRWNLDGIYKPTHVGHPCTKWAMKSTGNMDWLLEYGRLLGVEYVHRFGKPHKSAGINALQREIFNRDILPKCGMESMTLWQNSARNEGAGVDCTHLPVPQSYKSYLNLRWPHDKRRPKWTNREMPEWAQFEWVGKLQND